MEKIKSIKKKPCVSRELLANEYVRLGHEILRRKSPEAGRDYLFYCLAVKMGKRTSELLDSVKMGEFWDFQEECPLGRLLPQERQAALRWFTFAKRMHITKDFPYGPDELHMQSRKKDQPYQHERVSRAQWWLVIKSAAKRAGIDHDRISPESLRKTAGVRVERESPSDWGRKKKLLGHAKSSSTYNYLHTVMHKVWNLPEDELRKTSKDVILKAKTVLTDGTLATYSHEALVALGKDLAAIASKQGGKYEYEATQLFYDFLSAIRSIGELPPARI